MTIAFLCFAQSSATPTVALCELKSTTTSALPYHGGEIVALVNRADHFEFGNSRAHASSAWPMRPFDAGDDDFCHTFYV